MSVRIGFSTPRKFNLLSWLIMAVTASRASHAWLVYWSPKFRADMVLDAHSTGYRIVRLQDFMKRNEVVGIYQPRVNLEAGLPDAAGWLGSSYDFRGLLGMAVVYVGRWLKRTWKNPWSSHANVFCSESVLRVMHSVLYPGIEELKDPEMVSPQDLLDFLERQGAVKEL